MVVLAVRGLDAADGGNAFGEPHSDQIFVVAVPGSRFQVPGSRFQFEVLGSKF
jgi:hypothetical protein